MQDPSSPVSEAVERLGEAAVDNVTDAAARAATWAAALGAAADPAPGATPVLDDLAGAAASMWLGGLRAMAVAAAAVTDAAAILSCPPELVETYSVDLADQLPDRARPVRLAVQRVEWASANATGSLPVVAIVDAQPVAAPTDTAGDRVAFRVRPSVAPLALTVVVGVETVGTPAVEPMAIELRLSTENLVVDP